MTTDRVFYAGLVIAIGLIGVLSFGLASVVVKALGV